MFKSRKGQGNKHNQQAGGGGRQKTQHGGGNNNNNNGGRGGNNNKGGGGRGGGPNHRGGGGGNSGVGATKNILVTMLKLVFEKSSTSIYSAADGTLNIANLRACPDLQSVQKNILFDTPAFCDALCSVIKDLGISPSIMNLDDNNMTTLHAFASALVKNDLHHSLRAFSCAANHIKDLGFINPLSKCVNLNELRMVGNPCAKHDNYRKQISKRMPNLRMLDGEEIVHAPLAMPWPTPPQYSNDALTVLQAVEQALNDLDKMGPDNCTHYYHSECCLSFSSQMEISCIAKDKEASRALAHMKTIQKDKNRNLVGPNKPPNLGARCATGRAEVLGMLAKLMYPKGFVMTHELDGQADCMVFEVGSGVKVQQSVLSVHGRMFWRHNKLGQNERVIQATFDRTFTVIAGDQGLAIVNDCISLRQPSEVALFDPRSDTRLGQIAAKYEIAKELLTGLAQVASNDRELISNAQACNALGGAVLTECFASVGNDVNGGSLVALVCAQTPIKPSSAAQLLTQSSGDVAAAVQAASSLGQDHYRTA